MKKPKIKILHISKMKGVSGSENHLLTLLAGLDPQRFEAHLCILAESAHIAALLDYQAALERAGAQVRIVPMRKYVDVSALWTLRRYIRQHHIQLVHTHLIHADLYGTLAAKLAGGARLVSSRHNDDRFRHSRPVIWLNRVLAHWHERIIVISDWIGQFLQEVEGIAAEKIVRIHYGLDPDALVAQLEPLDVRREFALPEAAPLFITIGRLTAQKGQIYLLQALKRVKTVVPDVRVLIVGDGELQHALQQEARGAGLASNVIFTGYRSDALRLLAGSDVFVFPSLWEGFGLVLLEAMALKKAVVASRVSAIPESVRDGETGLLVPPEDPERLAEAMLTLLRNPDLARKMGENGYAHLRKNFAVHKMIAATEQMYHELLTPPPAPPQRRGGD